MLDCKSIFFSKVRLKILQEFLRHFGKKIKPPNNHHPHHQQPLPLRFRNSLHISLGEEGCFGVTEEYMRPRLPSSSSSSSYSAFPAISLWFTILGEIFAYVTVFLKKATNIEIVTFHLRGWCLLDAFLLRYSPV